MDTSARLLRLLALLQSRRDWSGPDLAQRLEVTTRTIRNDVDRLRNLGYAVDAKPGSDGGYRLGVGAVTPPLLLDDDEAVAIAVALSTAAGASVAGIEETAVRALVKLQHLLPSRLRQRVSALRAFTVAMPALCPMVDADTLTTIASACRDNERLLFDYHRHDGAPSRRDIEPHRLVNAGRRWYLVGWDTDRQDWRTFRVDRVAIPANHIGPRFVPRDPPEGDIATHVATGVGSATWNYRARVIAHAPADTLIARLPPSVIVEPLDDSTCSVDVGSDTPQMLALYLGMLDVDFDIENKGENSALIDHLRQTADRYRRVVDASDADL